MAEDYEETIQILLESHKVRKREDKKERKRKESEEGGASKVQTLDMLP